MVLFPLNLQSSEFEEDLPSSLVTNGVSTEIESLSPSRADESVDVFKKMKPLFVFFFPLSTFAYRTSSSGLSGE